MSGRNDITTQIRWAGFTAAPPVQSDHI